VILGIAQIEVEEREKKRRGKRKVNQRKTKMNHYARTA
jgi:hypothetical protein